MKDKYKLVHQLNTEWYQQSLGFGFSSETDKKISVSIFKTDRKTVYVPFIYTGYYLILDVYS